MKGIRQSALSLALVLAFTVAVSTTPAPARAEQYVPHKTMWVEKRANVRTGPSTSFPKTDLLEAGERVSVVAKTGDWFELYRRSGQPKRFVYAPLLTDSKPVSSGSAHSDSRFTIETHSTTFDDGSSYEGEYKVWHEGQLRMLTFHGYGVYRYPSGARYEGDWVDGEEHGYGVLIYANGARYEGNWVGGEQHGYGVYVYSNGDRYEGNWVDGEPPDDGKIVHATETAEELGGDNGGSSTEGSWIAVTFGHQGRIMFQGSMVWALAWDASSEQQALSAVIQECRKRGGNYYCDSNPIARSEGCIAVGSFEVPESGDGQAHTRYWDVYADTADGAIRQITVPGGRVEEIKCVK